MLIAVVVGGWGMGGVGVRVVGGGGGGGYTQGIHKDQNYISRSRVCYLPLRGLPPPQK